MLGLDTSNASGGSFTYAPNVSGAVGLAKTGNGTLILSGNNSYAGGTTVYSGTLQVSKAASLPGRDTFGMITMSDGTTLVLSAGGSGEFGTPDLTDLLTNAIFNSNTVLSIDTSNGSVESAGSSSQSLKLVKLGANTLTLSGANSYTGGTVIGAANQANAGTLRLSGVGTLGSGGFVTVYGGTLDLNGTTQTMPVLTLGGGAAGSTAAVTIGAGQLLLGGNIEFLATNNPAGAVISGAGGGVLGLLADRTFTVGDSTATVDDLTISANITNGDAVARSLIKAGAGTLVLSGTNNTYGGTTTVSAGTLRIAQVGGVARPDNPGQRFGGRRRHPGRQPGRPGGVHRPWQPDCQCNVRFLRRAWPGHRQRQRRFVHLVDQHRRPAQHFQVGIRHLGFGGVRQHLLRHHPGLQRHLAGQRHAGQRRRIGQRARGRPLSVVAGGTVGRNVTVSGGTLNFLAGTMASGSTITLSAGTVNTSGGAATAATIAVPLAGSGPVFNAPAGQDLSVTSTFTQTLPNSGSATITAGATPFRLAGANLVNNIDKFSLSGGTTTMARADASTGVSMTATELAVTGTNTLNLGSSSAKSSFGALTLGAAALTLQSASSASFANILATDDASILGTVPVSLRTGNVSVSDGKTLTINQAVANDSPAAPLTKLDDGTLVLAGTSTYTGATNVSAGTLSLTGTLTSTAITVSSGATLTGGASAVIGGSASLTVYGTASLSGANAYSGATTVNSGTLTLGGTNTGSGGTVLNGGTLVVTNSGALQRSVVTFNGGAVDTGALTSVSLGSITANVDIPSARLSATIAGVPTWDAAPARP